MTSFQAAIGRVQLRKLDKLNEIRRSNAQYLSSLLKDVDGIELPAELPWAKHVYHLYAVKILRANRDCVAKCMKEKGIEVGIHYPIPINKQPLFRKLGYGNECMPNSDKLSRVELSLPTHPGLTNRDIEVIAKELRLCLERCS